MPTPSTPRKSSNRQSIRSPPSKPASEVGRPLALSDANSVRDRIRQWQEQGGGVISDSEGGAEDADEITPIVKEKERSARQSTSRRKSGRGREDDRDDVPRDRSKTPRKRLVSDEHWKKIRSPSLSTVATPRIGTRIDGEYTTTATPTRDERRQRRKDDRARERHDRDSGEDKIYSPASSRRQSDNRKASEELPDTDSGMDDRVPEILRSPTPSPKEGSGHGNKGDKSKRRWSSQDQLEKPERSPKSVQGAFSEAHGSVITRKSSIFSQVLGESKKLFTKAEPAPIPSPRVPSIEAWLQETPDPFVDAEQAPIEVPLPLSTKSKKRRVTTEPTIHEDPNKIWEAIGGDAVDQPKAQSAERRRRRRSQAPGGEDDTTPIPAVFEKDSAKQRPVSPRTSPKPEMTIQDAKDTEGASPSPLRRRGAKGHTARTKSGSSPLKGIAAGSEPSSKSPDPLAEYSEQFDAARPAPLNLRSCPPTGSHRLSTIASVETFQTTPDDRNQEDAPLNPLGPEDTVDPNQQHRGSNGLKRRLTTHADLMSVLSLPQHGAKSIQSARSIRTKRSKLATATLPDLLNELATDEAKYMRELRTLVDGVIPVLLSCVLSKSDTAVAAGLFRPSGTADDNMAFTKPIVDMGVALERMKTLHKRIPTHDVTTLLSWAQGAQKVYAEYLRAWRLGFQDVVVNLAPAVSDGKSDAQSDEGMSRDENGDIVDLDGEKVDVAFLLKRPLVRLKYLTKIFRGVNIVRPSTRAEEIATTYQELVDTARRRANEERARLEDEAAAAIDALRARDPRTMAVLSDVTIDKTRTVRARDYFNLTLHHSTGQRVDCKTELLLRDNAPGESTGGDVLICEVDDSGRWLLFPPVETSRLSARDGDFKGEIVVMIRGMHAHGEWHELLALRTEDEGTAFEWLQMLGLTPAPPKLVRSQSFVARHRKQAETNLGHPLPGIGESTPVKSRTPSPREIEVPIGEPSVTSQQQPSTPTSECFRDDKTARSRTDPLASMSARSSTDTSHWSTSRLRRAAAKKLSQQEESQPANPSISNSTDEVRPAIGTRKLSRSDSFSKEWMSSPETTRAMSTETPSKDATKLAEAHGALPIRPGYQRAPSSAPTEDLPTIPKIRSSTQPSTPLTESPMYDRPGTAMTASPEVGNSHKSAASTPLTNSIRDQWSVLTSWNKKSAPKEGINGPSKFQKQENRKESYPGMPFTEDIPSPPTPRSSSPTPASPAMERAHEETPPAPPVHRAASPVQLMSVPVLQLPPTPKSSKRASRRPSSPLKHEYAPSTASETDEDSDSSPIEDASSDSETSEEELEDGDAPTPLLPIEALRRYAKPSPPTSLPTLSSATLAPSNSASQAPYRTVPPQSYSKSAKTIATIYSWSEEGRWDQLHPDECSIVITDGLIEAYEMTAAHSGLKGPAKMTSETTSDLSSAVSNDERPLVALELTPVVQLRRGTALDISIRSPPTENSKIKSGKNTMFRSRNAEECEALYAHINQARIHNPTYIALQNARPANLSHPAVAMGLQGGVRGSRSGSWFGGSRRPSYRASSAPAPSVGGASESSVGSFTSAFSALRRFGAGSGRFNLTRSSVHSRTGGLQHTPSLLSSSSGSRTTRSGASTPAPSQAGARGGAIGLSNTRVRFYIRATVSKWDERGYARLTILPAPTSAESSGPPTAAHGPRLASSDHSPHTRNGREKRIIIHGQRQGEVLLDECLGESRFERMNRTGIAISVWKETETIGNVGGVVGGRTTLYLIQLQSEAEAAYTFGLLGRPRS